jgi:ABC-type transport system involved in multi-copper enzyme maturation permease subunit
MTPQGIATVARQEFRLRIRAGRWRLLLGIWFAILLLFTVLLRAAIGGFNENEIVDKGVVIYGGLMLFVLGLALLVVPALAAQSVNGDRERGTLATLQVTRLTPADITLGKFCAAWGTSLVFLALTLPLVVYAITQKGVPVGRVLIVTVVLALLLGTVCAIALALSALLSRTTTSGVLAYLAVFALTLGTLITFALVTAMTSETYTQTYTQPCPAPSELPPGLPQEERDRIQAMCGRTETFQASRTRTDRTWWLLAPNPFVVLADAAPKLPEPTAAEERKRREAESRGENVQDARDLDPLGGIGDAVRDLRKRPSDNTGGGFVYSELTPQRPEPERKPVWPYGLGFDVAVAVGALLLTTRRLRTPTRNLPKGQRVA